MVLFFKFGQAVPEIFKFYCSKKEGFFRQDLEGTYISGWNGTKKRFLMVFFCNFLEINTHTLSKMTQNLKISACFMQNFMELYLKKNLDLKAVTFAVWGLKTTLWYFGPKACGTRDLSSHMSRTLAPTFTNKTSFSPES